MSWGMFAGFGAKILDKLIPTRKQREYGKIKKLEKRLKKALADNDGTTVAITRNELRQLRREIYNIEE